MTADEIRGFFLALSRGRFDELAERLEDDVVLEFPGSRFGGRFEGKRKVLVFLKQNQRLFRGGLRFDIGWAGVSDDRAIAQWTNEGATRSGEPYTNRGATVFTIRDGRIARIEDYLDTERVRDLWGEE